jgi:nucleotide-binding universal stress UspA family protein
MLSGSSEAMSIFSSLLLPLDGSQMAARAVGCAVWLGSQLESHPRLHILSATTHPLSAHEELTRLRVPESCWPRVTLHRAERLPEEAILRVAKKYNVGLIIMSAHGEGRNRTSPAGTALDNVGHVSRAVIEQSSGPVLLLPDAYRERLPWRQVLVPVSAEAQVSPAASLAISLANDLELRVRIAHVLDDPSGEAGLERATRYADAAHHEYPQQFAELVRRAIPTATLEECRRIVDVVLLRGDVAGELLRQVESNDVSLIVIGWHGSLVAGHAKVVRSLLSAITCPMLLVKAPPPNPFTLKVGPRMA